MSFSNGSRLIVSILTRRFEAESIATRERSRDDSTSLQGEKHRRPRPTRGKELSHRIHEVQSELSYLFSRLSPPLRGSWLGYHVQILAVVSKENYTAASININSVARNGRESYTLRFGLRSPLRPPPRPSRLRFRRSGCSRWRNRARDCER